MSATIYHFVLAAPREAVLADGPLRAQLGARLFEYVPTSDYVTPDGVFLEMEYLIWKRYENNKDFDYEVPGLEPIRVVRCSLACESKLMLLGEKHMPMRDCTIL